MTTLMRRIGGVLGMAMAMLLGSTAAHAGVMTTTFTNSGADVVGTTTGSLDLSGMTYFRTDSIGVSRVGPSLGFFFFDNGGYDVYEVEIPDVTFGAGSLATADSSSGSNVGFWALANFIYVDAGYISGSSIAATATWSGQTLASLGMTEGTYSYAIGANTWTVRVGNVPEPGGIGLVGLALAGLAATRRRAAS